MYGTTINAFMQNVGGCTAASMSLNTWNHFALVVNLGTGFSIY